MLISIFRVELLCCPLKLDPTSSLKQPNRMWISMFLLNSQNQNKAFENAFTDSMVSPHYEHRTVIEDGPFLTSDKTGLDNEMPFIER